MKGKNPPMPKSKFHLQFGRVTPGGVVIPALCPGAEVRKLLL